VKGGLVSIGANAGAMICPHCGIPMNRHAEKLVYEMGRIDEVHECPRCGRSGSRAAADQTDALARART
jgi:hypothetical protein